MLDACAAGWIAWTQSMRPGCIMTCRSPHMPHALHMQSTRSLYHKSPCTPCELTTHETSPPCTPRACEQEHASGSAVVAEYMTALVASGRLQEYVGAVQGGSTATGAAVRLQQGTAAAGGDGLIGQDHRSLYQLLAELQAQVWGVEM
eukprot:364788-Chlamydomonas_euryale.AAC.3